MVEAFIFASTMFGLVVVYLALDKSIGEVKKLLDARMSLQGNAIRVQIDSDSDSGIELTIFTMKDGKDVTWWKSPRSLKPGDNFVVRGLVVATNVEVSER